MPRLWTSVQARQGRPQQNAPRPKAKARGRQKQMRPQQRRMPQTSILTFPQNGNRRRNQSRTVPGTSWTKRMLHPLLHNPHWTVPLLATTKYVSVIERIILPIQTSLTVAKVIQIGRYYQPGSGGNTLSPCVAKYGLGTDVPGTTETSLNSALITAGNFSRCNIGRLGITISCTGTASTNGMPDGIVYSGTADGVLDRTAFATFNLMIAALATRHWLGGHSAYSLMQKPRNLVSHPLDMISYNDFIQIGITPSGTDLCSDGIAPIFIYLPATVNLDNYVIDLYVDWRVIYSSDNVLSNVHSYHPVVQQGVLNNVIRSAEETAGDIGTELEFGRRFPPSFSLPTPR